MAEDREKLVQQQTQKMAEERNKIETFADFGNMYNFKKDFTYSYKTDAGQGVRVARVEPDRKDFRSVYDPSHPSADAKGYVKLPNVDTLVEALDMKEAQRAYEANLNVIETARAMEQRTLDILKK